MNWKKIRIIAFWISTGIIALETGTGAEWDLVRNDFVRNIMQQLGYPAYTLTIMGVWKLFGVIVLLIPGFPRAKEWVYAGLVFIYSGAAASHLATGDTSHAIGPVIFTGLTFASWATRPASRRIFTSWPYPATTPMFSLSSRTRNITYWVMTALVAFQLGSGGVGDLLRPTALVEGMTHLGYPVYFCVILGIWKVLGAIAVLVPRYPRLKEWAYAGAIFDLTGAAASHLAVEDPAVKLIGPLLFTAFAVASWALRPIHRAKLALPSK